MLKHGNALQQQQQTNTYALSSYALTCVALITGMQDVDMYLLYDVKR